MRRTTRFRPGRLALAAVLSACVPLGPAMAEILFRADFETGDFRQFSGTTKKNVKPGHIEVVRDIVHSGQHAGRFTIHEDNVYNAQQLRVQANGPKVTVQEGTDTYASFWMFMKDAPKDADPSEIAAADLTAKRDAVVAALKDKATRVEQDIIDAEPLLDEV